MRTLDDADKKIDGMTPHAAVLLSSSLAGPNADGFCRTLIHETGHVLGLPDLYTYDENESSNPALGVRSFDMMCNNTGDIDGFCKWALGWIDPEQITFMYVSKNGVDVVRDGDDPKHYDGSVDEALEAYSSGSDVSKTGGFIAISNDKKVLEGDLLSNFYLVEYTTLEGNDSLGEDDIAADHGFRLFRVQATLTPEGNFLHNNTSNKVHDQLIEALVPSDDTSVEYEAGSLYHAGMTATPTTVPSTNFGENIMSGFTGIALSIDDERTDSGDVSVTYEARPEAEPLTWSFESASGSANCATYVLRPLRSIATNWRNGSSIMIEVDGKEHEIAGFDYDESVNKLSVYVKLDAVQVKNGSKLKLKIPAEKFVTDYDESGEESGYSDAVTIDLPDAAMADVEHSGEYDDAAVPIINGRAMSDVFEVGGKSCFLMYQISYDNQQDGLSLYTLGDEGKQCKKAAIADSSGLSTMGVRSMQVLTLADGTVYASVEAYSSTGSGDAGSVTELWIDPSTHRVLARRENPQGVVGNTAAFPLAGGVATAALDENGIWEVALLRRNGSDISEERVAWPAANSWDMKNVVDAGNGYVAAYAEGNGMGADGELMLWRASDVKDATSFAKAEPTHRFTLTDNCHVSGVRVANGHVYVCALNNHRSEQGDHFVSELAEYDMSGKLLRSVEIPQLPFSFTDTVSLRVSASGCVAVVYTCDNSNDLGRYSRNFLFDADLKAQGEFASYDRSAGAWMGERWLALGWNARFAAKNDMLHVHWDLTRALAKGNATGGSEEGAGPTDPSKKPSDKTTQTQVKVTKHTVKHAGKRAVAGGLVSTGDYTMVTIAGLLVLAAVVLGLGIFLWKRRS